MCERDSEFVDDEGASARERLRQIKRGGGEGAEGGSGTV